MGAVVEVKTGEVTQSWLVRTGGSYMSQSQLYPTFGLGEATQADEVVVRWPSGAVQRRTGVAAGQRIEFVEEAAEPTDGQPR